MKNKIAHIILTSCILLLGHQAVNSQVVINEFMAANSTTIYDPDNNESADWAELYNSSSSLVDISGYFLTDNLSNPDKWAIPVGTTIPGHGFLIIWADGTDSDLHASFNFSSDGEEIGLFDNSLNPVDTFTYTLQQTDISYGRQPDGGASWYWYLQPSPGYTNSGSTGYAGITYYEPVFSVKGGFYSSQQSLELTSLGGTVHYTLDGTTPTEADPIYSTNITFNQSTFVRARVFQNNFVPGPVVTHSYFFDSSFEQRGLPVVSLVTDPEYFWSPDSGIYVQNFKPEWEYPINIEFFENDGNNRAVFNQMAGVKINGTNSWVLPQKMLGIYFRNEYGNNSLDYPVFNDRDRISYNELVLRAAGDDWANTLFRDGLAQDLTQENAPVPHQGFRPSMVFINGEYLGIHNIRSRIDDGFVEDNYQMEAGTFDMIDNDGEVNTGSDVQFLEMDARFNADLSIQSNFDSVAAIVDIENYTNYWITEIWTANSSWGHNVIFWKPKVGGKWQFVFTDLDRGFSDSNFSIDEYANPSGNSSYNYARYWMEGMFGNADYAAYFAQRFNDHIYTSFHPRRVNNKIDGFANTITNEIPYHVAKWSGSTSSYGDGIVSVAFWQNEVLSLKQFAEARHTFMMSELQSTFGLGSIANLSTACFPEDAGKIHLNDFVVPELPWNGPYFEQMPFHLTAKAQPGYDFEGWSHISQNELVSLAEVWKYNDSGQNLGTSWKETNFNDASWSSGPAELGYGDGDEATTVSYGGNTQSRYITTYFRKQFLYTGTQQALNAILKIRRDDGAVVYLNGVEIARSNMPSGTIGYQSLAVSAIASSAEDELVEYFIETPMLNDTNVIAVEIHQVSATSSDISFDLSFAVSTASQTIVSTQPTLDITLSSDSGFIARFQPTGACMLPLAITADTTLTIACSPYLASGDVTVMPNVSLTIDPGVEIWFPDGASLIVKGDLDVNGTQTQPVLFKANTDYGATKWDIVLFYHATGVSYLDYLEIKDASKGLHPVQNVAAISVVGSELNMDHLVLEANFANPIYAINSNITLSNSNLHSDITGDLINVKYGNSIVDNCRFIGNDQPDTDAIDYDGVINGVISNSSIEKFYGYNSDGVDLGEGSQDVLIENCFINDITDKGISIGQYSTASVQNTTIANCNLGFGIKDKGGANIDHVTFYSNAIAISVYEKNPGFGGGEVFVRNSILSNSSISPMFTDALSFSLAEKNMFDTDTLQGNSNLLANPYFIDPTDFDFQLQAASGAKNAGLDGNDLGTLNHQFTSTPKLMISDIFYYHPIDPDKEFIRLLNAGLDVVDLSGYSISGGIEFVFPEGASIAPNEKIIIARYIAPFTLTGSQLFEWGTGHLANEGEKLVLADSNGIIVDHVWYQPVSPWPVIQVADDFISLISPTLDNHFGSSWHIGEPLAVPELVEGNSNLQVFPIPTSDYLYIQSDETISSVQIVDITGRMVMEEQDGSFSTKLNVKALKQGVYLAIVNGNHKVKFVKN